MKEIKIHDLMQPTDVEDYEYTRPCQGRAEPECDEPASWGVWVCHNTSCEPFSAFICDGHEAALRQMWTDVVTCGMSCALCGFTFKGKLSNYFRAIKL